MFTVSEMYCCYSFAVFNYVVVAFGLFGLLVLVLILDLILFSSSFCFVLFCFDLFCFVLFCFVLFCFVLFCVNNDFKLNMITLLIYCRISSSYGVVIVKAT